jgi:hypothetical protein
MPHEVRPFAPVEAGEDQQGSLLRVFAQAQAALNQRLVHGQQDEAFFVGVEARHRGVVREFAVQDPLLRDAAALVFIGAHRLDDGLGVGIDAFRLEQHPTAELQLPHHAGTGQQAHHRFQFVVGEARVLAREAQLQRLPHLVEAHQHPAPVLEADDLVLEPASMVNGRLLASRSVRACCRSSRRSAAR